MMVGFWFALSTDAEKVRKRMYMYIKDEELKTREFMNSRVVCITRNDTTMLPCLLCCNKYSF